MASIPAPSSSSPSPKTLKLRARDLLDALRRGDPAARQRYLAVWPVPDPTAHAGLRRCQHVVAQESGCRNWSDVLTVNSRSGFARFEAEMQETIGRAVADGVHELFPGATFPALEVVTSRGLVVLADAGGTKGAIARYLASQISQPWCAIIRPSARLAWAPTVEQNPQNRIVLLPADTESPDGAIDLDLRVAEICRVAIVDDAWMLRQTRGDLVARFSQRFQAVIWVTHLASDLPESITIETPILTARCSDVSSLGISEHQERFLSEPRFKHLPVLFRRHAAEQWKAMRLPVTDLARVAEIPSGFANELGLALVQDAGSNPSPGAIPKPPTPAQSLDMRLAKLRAGLCPIHGADMTQVEPWSTCKDGAFRGMETTIVKCVRADCSVRAHAISAYGPHDLLPEHRHLLTIAPATKPPRIKPGLMPRYGAFRTADDRPGLGFLLREWLFMAGRQPFTSILRFLDHLTDGVAVRAIPAAWPSRVADWARGLDDANTGTLIRRAETAANTAPPASDEARLLAGLAVALQVHLKGASGTSPSASERIGAIAHRLLESELHGKVANDHGDDAQWRGAIDDLESILPSRPVSNDS